ncbi:MAG: hypothetical protein A2583_06850 [Bdellovibrionales bacterium RIFOXYD1_FULL_53_11]|nr:MAG: hypothetical protein A2583_06850 [Bdellovibrionales bacterium RIFOXYD1_FULL_53_11]
MAFKLTKTVKVLLGACLALFLLQQTADRFMGADIESWLALVPSGVVLHHRVWQLITYAFLHGDVTHLILNMLMLVFIGSEIETVWGVRRFLRYYFFCSVFAGMVYLFLQVFVWGEGGLNVPMVGASGAIYGLLLAYGLMFGERKLLFFMLFPMKAKHFVWILAAVEFMTTVYSGRSGLASAAHLAGMAAGFMYLWVRASYILVQQRKARIKAGGPGAERARSKPLKSHLKLVINNERDIKKIMDEDNDRSGPWN